MNCERMPKKNVLMLAGQVEQGNIEEEIFWDVIKDVKELRKIPKMVTMNEMLHLRANVSRLYLP